MYTIVKVGVVLYLFGLFVKSINLDLKLSEKPTTAIICCVVAVLGIALPLVLRKD